MSHVNVYLCGHVIGHTPLGTGMVTVIIREVARTCHGTEYSGRRARCQK